MDYTNQQPHHRPIRPWRVRPTPKVRGLPETWPSDESRVRERERFAEMREHAIAQAEAHLAKHGPHVCRPDPADPWSVCDLDTP